MNKLLNFLLLLTCLASVDLTAQQLFTLDSCRSMALSNNKELLIADQKIKEATYERKSARANFLPAFDARAAYLFNQKNIELISDHTINSLSSSIGEINTAIGGIAGSLDPEVATVIGGLGEQLEKVPDKLKDETTFDIKNVFLGNISVEQPLFMGGKIWAYHEITKYAEELAKTMKRAEVKDIIIDVDQIYWQVVSLVYKEKMAESYVQLLDTLMSNVNDMFVEGIATESDKLTVAVKLNEANVVLTKVKDGLSLSKMLLAQRCGLPISSQYNLADEVIPPTAIDIPEKIDLNEIYKHRNEIAELELASKIFKKKEVIARAEMLPEIAFIGNYILSNPMVYDGFQNKFSGMFSLGVSVSIPIFHWGKNYYKVKAAKSATDTYRLKLADAKELIELEVNQAVYKAQEANKTLLMTITNMNMAERNLENAQFGYLAGVLTTENVLEAQTAWLKAESEKIDAEIGVKLSQVYLSKAIGKNF